MADGMELNSEGDNLSEFEKPNISGWAKASLIMGILGLTALPVIGAILAIVFARIAKKKILYDDFLGGDGLATAGQTLGIIGLLLVAIAVFILLMQARLKAFVDDFFNWDTIKVWWPS